MRNLKLTVRYDGTAFYGWQTQPGYRTVQETLEKVLESITNVPRVRLNASGRTDAGVHALGQVVNFYSPTKLDHATIVKAVNGNLPDDVSVSDCTDATQSFDASKDAVGKTYRYQIQDGRIGDPFLRRYAWHPRRVLDAEAMHRAAQALVGRHDFRSFETNWPNRMSSIRTISELRVYRHENVIRIEVTADGFLYNMVRSITGTLYQVGRAYWPESKVKEIIDSMDRCEAGPTAPPQGLFLVRVMYNGIHRGNSS
jgi:tRNA pseudouridine38-40 synthase